MIKGFYTTFYEPKESIWYIIVSDNEHELKTTYSLEKTMSILESIYYVKKETNNKFKVLHDTKEELIETLFLLEQYEIHFSKQLNNKFNLRNPEFTACNNIHELETSINCFYNIINLGLKVYERDVNNILDKISDKGYNNISAKDILILKKAY